MFMPSSQLSFSRIAKVNICMPSFTHSTKSHWIPVGYEGRMLSIENPETNDTTLPEIVMVKWEQYSYINNNTIQKIQ